MSSVDSDKYPLTQLAEMSTKLDALILEFEASRDELSDTLNKHTRVLFGENGHQLGLITQVSAIKTEFTNLIAKLGEIEKQRAIEKAKELAIAEDRMKWFKLIGGALGLIELIQLISQILP